MAKAHKDITLSKRKDGAPSPLWPERTRGLNFFRVDHNLQRFLTRYYPVLMQNEEKRLEDLGKFCSTELEDQAEYSDRIHPPVLTQEVVDRIRPDERRGHVYLNERYKDTQQELYRRELLAKCFGPENKESHMLPFIGQYLVSHSDVSTGCPFAMTHPVAYVLAHYAPEFLRQKYLPELLRTDGATAVGGTWATEKHSGSDIGNTTTKVTKHRDGHHRLQGHNWFTSAIGFRKFLTLKTARPEAAPGGSKGLGLYLVPSHIDDDWSIPNEYNVTHLKDKLGTRGLPTGEVTLDGTLCHEIVPAGQGVKIMMEALGCSRVHNAMGSAGIMHRALLESLCWTSHRAPFGKRLIEQPMIQKRLVDIMTEWMAGSALAFHAAHGFDEAVHDPSQKPWVRIVTALAKFKTAEQAVWCADKALTLIVDLEAEQFDRVATHESGDHRFVDGVCPQHVDRFSRRAGVVVWIARAPRRDVDERVGHARDGRLPRVERREHGVLVEDLLGLEAHRTGTAEPAAQPEIRLGLLEHQRHHRGATVPERELQVGEILEQAMERRGGEEHTRVLDPGHGLGDRVADVEPLGDAFGVRAGRRWFRIGNSDRRVHARDHTELLELAPKRLKVVAFDELPAVEHRAQRGGAEALGRDAVELALREGQALQRQDRDRVESTVARRREVGDPVVVGAREHIGGDGVFDQRVVLEKQRRVHDRLVDAERVHVGEPRTRVARPRVDPVGNGRVEPADVVERHAGAPDRLPVDRAAVHLLRGPSVEDGQTAPGVLEVPERGASQPLVARWHVRIPRARPARRRGYRCRRQGTFARSLTTPVRFQKPHSCPDTVAHRPEFRCRWQAELPV